MKLLIFLGNPGPQYEHTRHNIGFLVGDELAKTRNCPAWSLDKQSKSLTTKAIVPLSDRMNPGTGRGQGEVVLLVKPQTFMNLSGQTVSSLLGYYKLTPADIVVIHDDIDLPLETIRRKFGGSSGGQNGIKDIIAKLGTDNFARIKIGIDRPSHPSADIADYVLSKLPKDNIEQMRQTADEVLKKLQTHFF